MISNANRVFNINVVTEDGRTQHEDYPHEIDIDRYPQFSPQKHFEGVNMTRNVTDTSAISSMKPPPQVTTELTRSLVRNT